MKNNIDPKSILLYLAIIAFVLIYNKTGSGNTGAAEICAGQIDGFKKFINAAAVFDFELRFQLLYG